MLTISLFILIASLVDALPPPKRARTDAPPVVQVSSGLAVAGLSPSNRFVEVYNFTEILKVYGEAFTKHLLAVTDKDLSNDAFTPIADSSSFENTPQGRLKLGARFASSEYSVIYEIIGNPHLLIKYQANCELLDPDSRISDTSYVHPLVVDYIFGRKAAAVKVGPRIYYLSPPSQLCSLRKGKCRFDSDKSDFQRCAERDGASLRYMIMERVQGESLFAYKGRFENGIVPFHTSLLIGAGMIWNLERLHNVAKTVHGDVHYGNILIKYLDDRNGTISLKFIDYGRSFTNVERFNETVRELGWARSSFFSSWELEGYESGPRDDIERAVNVVSLLMLPTSYFFTAELIAERSPTTIIEVKRSANLFVEHHIEGRMVTPRYDPVGALRNTDENKALIRQCLQMILGRVRSMGSSVNSVPPYADLLRGFKVTRHIARGLSRVALVQQANTTITP